MSARVRFVLTLGCAMAALALTRGLIAAQVPVLWEEDGIEVCGAEESQTNPDVAADGTGGAIIAWEDSRSGDGDHIYAQRINALGRPLWGTDGVTVCGAAGSQGDARVVPDGESGAIIVWRDGRTSDYDIYAQRVFSDGTMAWATDGISVCAEAGEKDYLDAASDEKGGALVTWQDYRTEANYRVYAQRVDEDGNTLWYTDGVTICADAGQDCQYPVIAPDGRGGAFVAWQYKSNVYVQFLWANGDFDYRWNVDGERVALSVATRTDPDIAFDGDDSALVVWRDGESDSDVHIQSMHWAQPRTWGSGVPVCEAEGTQHDVKVASDGEGGALVVWSDQRDGGGDDIYARRVFFNGTPLWITDGVSLCTESGTQSNPRIVSDGDGGAIAVWEDDGDLYAQKVDRSGVILGEQDGIPVCTEGSRQESPEMAFDGVLGAVVAWHDDRGADMDIYAQRVGITDVGLPLMMKRE